MGPRQRSTCRRGTALIGVHTSDIGAFGTKTRTPAHGVAEPLCPLID